MKKLIIFDLDGVLLDSKEIHFNALNLALSDIDEKYIITQEEQASIFEGMTTRSKLNVLTKTKDFPTEKYEELWKKKQEYTATLFLGTGLDKDLVTLFRIIKSHNILVGVGSNSIRKTVDTCLSRLGVDSYVDLSLSNEDVENPKPSPDIYNKIIKDLGCSVDKTIIFEDSDIGRMAASLSGAKLFPINSRADLNFELIEKAINYLES
jgi:HAD superfamily hydrolase (TIGR01509 family)